MEDGMAHLPDALAPEMVPLPRAPSVFGLSRSGLYRLAAEGRIRMVKVGSRTLVDAASVRAFLAALPVAQINAGKAA
jgi:excisionase family DNA binding protein